MYRVHPDGTIECDDLEQAISLSRRLAVGPRASETTASPAPATKAKASTNDAVTFADLIKELKPTHHKALSVIKEREAVTLDELRTGMGMTKAFELSGVLGSLMKAINRLGIESEAVLVREQAGSGRNAVVTYKPGPMLRAAKEVG